MNVNYAVLSRYIGICLLPLAFASCNKQTTPTEPAAKSVATVVSEAPKALPFVTLSGIKVLPAPASPSLRVQIAASGPFGSNVIRKSDPERIIVIMHNAEIGKAPEKIEVNDGAISRIEIAQMDTGKGPAAKITIVLLVKSVFEVIPAESALILEIKKENRE